MAASLVAPLLAAEWQKYLSSSVISSSQLLSLRKSTSLNAASARAILVLSAL